MFQEIFVQLSIKEAVNHLLQNPSTLRVLWFSFLQGTPAGLICYKVDQEAYPYSASIFDVDKEKGHVVTRVNLNEEPNLKFRVSTYTVSFVKNKMFKVMCFLELN